MDCGKYGLENYRPFEKPRAGNAIGGKKRVRPIPNHADTQPQCSRYAHETLPGNKFDIILAIGFAHRFQIGLPDHFESSKAPPRQQAIARVGVGKPIGARVHSAARVDDDDRLRGYRWLALWRGHSRKLFSQRFHPGKIPFHHELVR